MYTQDDLNATHAQLCKRTIALCVPAVILLGLMVWSFIIRIEWATMLITCVLGAYIIFTHGLLLHPIIAYQRHLKDSLMGRTRETTGTFKEMELSPVTREGVRYFPMLISVGNPNEPEDDRLFYFDAILPRPAWQVGELLTITSHDKFVANWVRTQNP